MRPGAPRAYGAPGAAEPAGAANACLDGRTAPAAGVGEQAHRMIMSFTYGSPMEDKAARFTILIDADRKKAFDKLCAAQDMTSSQMIRQLIKDYLDRHGVTYTPTGATARKSRKSQP